MTVPAANWYVAPSDPCVTRAAESVPVVPSSCTGGPSEQPAANGDIRASKTKTNLEMDRDMRISLPVIAVFPAQRPHGTSYCLARVGSSNNAPARSTDMSCRRFDSALESQVAPAAGAASAIGETSLAQL